MVPREKQWRLVSISVLSFQDQPYISHAGQILCSAKIKGLSANRDLAFEIETGLLEGDLLDSVKRLQEHGSLVLEAPEDWRFRTYNPGSWMSDAVKHAISAAKKLSKNAREPSIGMSSFNEELAEKVLLALNKEFPNPMTDVELKHLLENEPSDEEMYTALDALHLDGLITGKAMKDYSSSRRRILTMAAIQITGQGRAKLSNAAQPHSQAVVHGDQIINFGNAGAIGRHSTGTSMFQQQWSDISSQIDMQVLANELSSMRLQLVKRARSRSDYQMLGVLAEAEEQAESHKGPEMMKTLAEAGKGLLEFTKDVATDLTAKVIAKALGLEP